MPLKPESERIAEATNALVERGYMVMRVVSGRLITGHPSYVIHPKERTSGVLDIIAFKDGRAVFCEEKPDLSEPLRPSQKKFVLIAEWANMPTIKFTGVDDLLSQLEAL